MFTTPREVARDWLKDMCKSKPIIDSDQKNTHHKAGPLIVVLAQINVLCKAGGGAEESAFPHTVPMNRNGVHRGVHAEILEQLKHNSLFAAFTDATLKRIHQNLSEVHHLQPQPMHIAMTRGAATAACRLR